MGDGTVEARTCRSDVEIIPLDYNIVSAAYSNRLSFGYVL